MNFSFVDVISDLVPGKSARGRCVVPAAFGPAPYWLAIEAVGQLASWIGMAHTEFRLRPVAALVGALALSERPASGATLELAVECQQCDANAIVYAGAASCAGVTVASLRRSLGPMLPMDDFDDGDTVQRRFAALRAGSAPPCRVVPVPPPALTVVDRNPGERLSVALQVPVQAPFFADHFPRKPVYPATLLIDAMCRVAVELAEEAIPQAAPLRPRQVRDVKIRAFTPPGRVIELRAQMLTARPAGADILIGAQADGRTIATARVEIGPLTPPA